MPKLIRSHSRMEVERWHNELYVKIYQPALMNSRLDLYQYWRAYSKIFCGDFTVRLLTRYKRTVNDQIA